MSMFLLRRNKSHTAEGGGEKIAQKQMPTMGGIRIPSSGTQNSSLCLSNNVLVAPAAKFSTSKSGLVVATTLSTSMQSTITTTCDDGPLSSRSATNANLHFHRNSRRIRQLCNSQSPEKSNTNDVLPDLSIDLIDIDDNHDGDTRIIAHLENECLKLNHRIDYLRERNCKYTEEWFMLETRLKSASEELDAARQDRDLHLLCCSGGHVVIATTQLPFPSEDNDKLDNNAHEVCLGASVSSDDRNHQVSTTSMNTHPENVVLSGDEFLATEAKSTMSDVSDAKNIKHRIHCDVDSDDEISSDNTGECTNKTHRQIILAKYRQIESELQKSIKYTPQWFRLKEELVELGIELDNDSKEVDIRNDDANGSSMKSELPEVNETPKEINVVMFLSGSVDQLLTSMIGESTPSISVSSPPISPISQGSLSSPHHSHNLSPSDKYFTQNNHNNNNNNNIAGSSGGIVGNNNQSRCPPPTNHRTASVRSRIGNGSRNIYCYSFNDCESDDGYGKDEMEEDTRNMLITSLKTEQASLSEELEILPQFSNEWFEVKMKLVGVSEKIVRLELEEVTREVLDNQSAVFDDGGSLGGDSSSRNNSGWSSVWSESEDEIWSCADELDIVMVAEALKQHSSLYNDQSDSFDDDLLFFPHQESATVLEPFQDLEFTHKPVVIQALVRGRIQRDSYLRQRRKAIIIQSWLRKTSAMLIYRRTVTSVLMIQQTYTRYRYHVRVNAAAAIIASSLIQAMVRGYQKRWAYVQLRIESIRIQAFVRGWLTRRNSELSMKLMSSQDFSSEGEATNRLQAMQEELVILRETESSEEELGKGHKKDGLCIIQPMKAREIIESDTTVPNFKETSPSCQSSLVISQILTEESPQRSKSEEQISSVARLGETFEEDSFSHAFAETKVIASTTPGTSTRESRLPGKKPRRDNVAYYKKNLKINTQSEFKGLSTHEKPRMEKIKTLSSESLILSRRLKSLPPFSPEWTLSKIELNLVIEELEYLYNINDVRSL